MSEKNISEITIIYDINRKNNIRIFGSEFVENNKDICKIIIYNKEYEIIEKYNIKRNNDNKLRVKLKGINKVSNMSYMFSGCSSLLSLPDISKWNTNNVTNMSYMFYNCSSLLSLPDISKWKTNNVIDMSSILVDAHHYYLYLIFQNGILLILLLWIICFIYAYHYHLYLIFQNGKLRMLLI